MVSWRDEGNTKQGGSGRGDTSWMGSSATNYPVDGIVGINQEPLVLFFYKGILVVGKEIA